MNMNPLLSFNADEKSKMFILYILTIVCIFLEIVMHFYLGVEAGYTHFFYVVLILAGIWFQRKAVILALCLAATHISIGYFVFAEALWVPILRSAMFVIVTLLVGTLSEELKQTAATVKENEARFRAIYEGSNDAIMLLNEKGFFDCNPRTLQMFGVKTKEDFCRFHPADLSPPSQPGGHESLPAAGEHIEAAFRNGFRHFEWIHRRTNGEDFPAEVLMSAFDWGKERVLQSTVRDVSERKRAEAALLAYISEMAMRLKIPVEIIRDNIQEITDLINRGKLTKEEMVIMLEGQVRNATQIAANVQEFQKAIAEKNEEIPEAYRKFLEG
jgi:PAS domain S-box-containing protein